MLLNPVTQTNYKTCTISGSMRYFDGMIELAKRLTIDGYMVFMPFVDKMDVERYEQPGNRERIILMLNQMHKLKILWTHELWVYVGLEKYIGESTGKEMIFAVQANRKVYMVLTADGTPIEWTGK